MSAEIDEQGVDIASSFRKHRHDVLNLLQLMRAYVQVDRSSDAIRVIDTCAIWLQSLTKWQTRCIGIASDLLWTAANCPHVILSAIDENMVWNENVIFETRRLLEDLEQRASELGWSLIYISIKQQRSEEGGTVITCELPTDLSDDEFRKNVLCANEHVHLEIRIRR